MRFRHFWGSLKIGPNSHETTRKIEVFWKGVFGTEAWRGESGPRTQGIWSRKWPFSSQVINHLWGTKFPSFHIYIYMYMYAVGSITWPHFGHFKVNNLATSRSITWPPFFEPIKISFFFRFFGAQFSGGGAKLVFFKVVLGQKRGLRKKNVHLFFGEFRLYFIVAAWCH